LLRSHHGNRWSAEKEIRFGSRRIDVLSISRGGKRVIGFEIKSAYADFKNELRTPQKTGSVLRFCTEFYFVVPAGLVTAAEVPHDCGLLYLLDNGSLSVVKRAPGGTENLPFEEDQLLDEFLRLNEWERHAGPELHDQAQIPSWMLPRFIRPLRFQFEVLAVAAALPGTASEYAIDFGRIPF